MASEADGIVSHTVRLCWRAGPLIALVLADCIVAGWLLACIDGVTMPPESAAELLAAG
jgi:hypothetical protein